jgi:hypothetical protein
MSFLEHFYNLLKSLDKSIDFILDDRLRYEIIILIKDYDNSKNTWLNIYNKLNKNHNYNYSLDVQEKSWYKIINNEDNGILNTLTISKLELLFNLLNQVYHIDKTENIIDDYYIKKNIKNIFKNRLIINKNETGYIYDENIHIYIFLDKIKIIKHIKNKIYNFNCEMRELLKYLSNQKNINIILEYIKKLDIVIKNNFDNILYELLEKYKNNIIFNNTITHDLPINNNKIINLQNGEIRQRNKSDYFTDFVKYNYLNDYNEIPDFIKNIFNNNIEMINFFQQILGYILTGSNDLQCFIIFYGNGSNGKSTLLKLLELILGNMFQSMSLFELYKKEPEYLIKKYNLLNKRLYILDECEKNMELDDRKIKFLVDKCYSKLILCTNYKPTFINNFSFTRRLVYIPFDITFVNNPIEINEKKLIRNIKCDLNEFFTWIVKGSIKYYNNDLNTKFIEQLKDNLISETYTVSDFIKNKIIFKNNTKIKSSILYDEYKKYSIEDDIILNQKQFSIYLKEKNYISKRYVDGVYWLNIDLI